MYDCTAVGCSDLVSPSDGAWLRRDGDEVVVGCYTSRQSWQLRCVDGVWTGTVGLCPQHHYHTDTDQLQSSHSNTHYGLSQLGTKHKLVVVVVVVVVVAVAAVVRMSINVAKVTSYFKVMVPS